MAWRQGKVGGIGAKESNKMRIIVNSPCTATTRVCVQCVECVAPQPVCQFALSLVVATCNELASERASECDVAAFTSSVDRGQCCKVTTDAIC